MSEGWGSEGQLRRQMQCNQEFEAGLLPERLERVKSRWAAMPGGNNRESVQVEMKSEPKTTPMKTVRNVSAKCGKKRLKRS